MRKNCFLSVMVGFATATTVASLASAQTEDINPTSDTFVVANSPTRNYGRAGALTITNPGASNGETSSLLRFDMSGVQSAFDTMFGAGQWMPTAASITLSNALAQSNPNLPFSPPASGTVDVSWLFDDSWDEGLGTPNFNTTDGLAWEDMPALLAGGRASAGSYSYTASTSGSATYSLSIPTGFANDVTSGSMMTLLFETDDASSLVFGMRFNGTDPTDPFMSITAGPIPVPEPGTLGLLTIGLLALRRR